MILRSKILRNLVSLSVAQIASKGVTLVTMAYLARVISPEGIGTLEFAKALLAYFTLIVNLGLDTLGTREIARDHNVTRDYVDSILSMKLILAIIAFVLYSAMVWSMRRSDDFKIVLYIMGFNLFPTALLLNFVYQGIERMGVIAVRTALTSVLNLLGVLLLVSGKHQVWLAAFVLALSTAINSIWLVFYYTKEYGSIRFSIDWDIWKKHLTKALPMAASFFMIAIYYNMDIVMLGFMKSEQEVGLYSAVYKILLLALIPSQVILPAFFPSISAEKGDYKAKRAKMDPYVRMMVSVSFPIAIFGFVFAPRIIQVVYGKSFLAAAVPLQILMFDVIFVYVNMIYGNPLLGWDKQKKYLQAISAGGIGNAVLNLVLIPRWGMYGAAVATVCGEIFVLVGLIFFHRAMTKSLYLDILAKVVGVSTLTSAIVWFARDFLQLPFLVVFGLTLYLFLIVVVKVVPPGVIRHALSMRNLIIQRNL